MGRKRTAGWFVWEADARAATLLDRSMRLENPKRGLAPASRNRATYSPTHVIIQEADDVADAVLNAVAAFEVLTGVDPVDVYFEPKTVLPNDD